MAAEELPSEFDVVIVGTGLCESVVAAACSRVGQRVLHLDRRSYYASDWASFTFNGLLTWIQEQQAEPEPEQPCDWSSLLQEGEELVHLNQSYSSISNLEVHSYVRYRASNTCRPCHTCHTCTCHTCTCHCTCHTCTCHTCTCHTCTCHTCHTCTCHTCTCHTCHMSHLHLSLHLSHLHLSHLHLSHLHPVTPVTLHLSHLSCHTCTCHCSCHTCTCHTCHTCTCHTCTCHPAPVTPAPVTPAPVTPVTPAPVTPAPVTPAPVTPAPVTPAPVTPAPVTPAPVTPAPVTPAPVTPVTPAPVTPAPVTPAPVTPAPVTPAPVTPAPVTPAPVTPAPVTPAPVTPAPVTAPVTPAPVTPVTLGPALVPVGSEEEASLSSEQKDETVTEAETSPSLEQVPESQSEACAEAESQSEACAEAESQLEDSRDPESQPESPTEPESPSEDIKEPESQSESAAEPESQSERRKMTLTDLVREGRRFNIDLVSKLLFSRGSLVDLLIQSNVPCSRADVFSSRQLSVVDKRKLMKFLTSCLDENDPYTDFSETPYMDFLEQQSLGAELRHFLFYSIAGATEETSTGAGLASTRHFLRCLGRYGNTPFLFPVYGLERSLSVSAGCVRCLEGCVCVFYVVCNCSAPLCLCPGCVPVFGGIYCLRHSAQSLIVHRETNSDCVAVVDSRGQRISCSHCVLEPGLLDQTETRTRTRTRSTSRAILITDRSILPSESDQVSLVSVPALVPGSPSVRLIELSSSTMTCISQTYVLLIKSQKHKETEHEALVQDILTSFSATLSMIHVILGFLLKQSDSEAVVTLEHSEQTTTRDDSCTVFHIQQLGLSHLLLLLLCSFYRTQQQYESEHRKETRLNKV
ncbi:hypothetical protein WMY93_012887 [Mugilogobius chulae]|uniref:RAE1/2 domain-containing protein n=1 Tax=Mugilogobius chulae TaxID=88201 RepID=A0AAW0PA97_9GOBI